MTDKIITTKVDKPTYDLLKKVSKEYGFRSIYELNKALITCFINSIETRSRSQPNEIDEMFSELSPTPVYGDHKRAPDNKSVNDEI